MYLLLYLFIHQYIFKCLLCFILTVFLKRSIQSWINEGCFTPPKEFEGHILGMGAT